MKKLLAMIFVAVFLASLIPMNNASASTTGPIKGIKHPAAGTFPIGLGDDIPAIDGSSFMETAVADEIIPMLTPQSPWTVAVSDDYNNTFYDLDFQQVVSGVHCNIWVGLSLDVWTGGYRDEWATNGAGFADDVFYFAYPWSNVGSDLFVFPPAISRLRPGYRDYIYGAQLEELRDAFDNNMWQQCKDFFGDYADRPGPNNDYKIQILIFNIRDGLFWDPVTAPWFIEGYFWYYISNLYNANIIHIDTYQWFRRQGPNPAGGEVAKFVDPSYAPGALLPYEYEGAFAHEFQHLIHRDLDYDEMSWVTEGCSGLAQYICGYGFPTGHIQQYIQYYRSTSLVIWQGSLANYGATFLWTFYMYEHYGAQFIHDVANNPGNGIAGYNNVLSMYGASKNFDAIFEDWAIANYLDDTSTAKGIYGYYALDIPSANTRDWSMPYAIYVNGHYTPGPLVPGFPSGLRLGMPFPYVVRYWEIYDGTPELKSYIDGADFTGIIPHSGARDWFSVGAANAWFRLGRAFTIPAGGATLKFWNNYGIEPDYDYGYVEVHDLSTNEWYTLPGIKTQTDTNLDSYDNPNCPIEFEPETYKTAGRWNAFTGTSGWYQETMDLTLFAGHDIELYFTYWTDPYTLGYGWAVDDIEIPEIGFFDDVESGANGWTYNAGWAMAGGVENDFRVNFIEITNFIKKTETRSMYYISPVKLDDATETGSEMLKAINTPTVVTGPEVLVAASQPGYEHGFSTTLDFYTDIQPFYGPH